MTDGLDQEIGEPAGKKFLSISESRMGGLPPLLERKAEPVGKYVVDKIIDHLKLTFVGQ